MTSCQGLPYTRAMSRDKRLQDRSIYPHWCSDTVRFSDQDGAGHVNNVAICAYMETARLTFMRDMGRMMAPREEGIRGISAGMTVSFLAESHWPGKVELGTGVLKIGTQLDHRRLGRLPGRPLHRRRRDDRGPAQGQGAPSDRRGLPGGTGKVPAEGVRRVMRRPDERLRRIETPQMHAGLLSGRSSHFSPTPQIVSRSP